MPASRRTFLKLGGLAAVATAGVTIPIGAGLQTKSASQLARSKMPVPYRTPFVYPPQLPVAFTSYDADGVLVKHFNVTERPGSAVIAPGLTTPVYGYNGAVTGPTIDIDKGTRAVLRIRNKLPATSPEFGHDFSTSTHLHGSASLPEYDGYANDLTRPGSYKEYRYPNFQAARTLWYHDHGVHHTAQNAYSGLAAMYRLHDPVERALLPQGVFDVPLVLTDVMLGADGRLAYDDRNHSGLWGDIILVNGRPWPVMPVQRRVYRFRVLNAAVSRSFRPTLSTGDPVTVVATDGGLIPVAQQVGAWRHGNAERYEVLIDFSRYPAGRRVELRNLSNENNRDFDDTGKIMAFDVTDAPVDTSDPTWNRIPTTLADSSAMRLTSGQATRTRKMRLHRDDVTNEWMINGVTWHDVVDSGFRLSFADVALNDVEIWEVENRGGGWFHPLHVHLVDFQVLSRNGRPAFSYERGPKDVVYVGEGETVRLLIKFEHQRGRYMIHCHNLAHEDHDMMTQFTVGLTAGQVDPHDPVEADRPRLDDLPEDA